MEDFVLEWEIERAKTSENEKAWRRSTGMSWLTKYGSGTTLLINSAKKAEERANRLEIMIEVVECPNPKPGTEPEPEELISSLRLWLFGDFLVDWFLFCTSLDPSVFCWDGQGRDLESHSPRYTRKKLLSKQIAPPACSKQKRREPTRRSESMMERMISMQRI